MISKGKYAWSGSYACFDLGQSECEIAQRKWILGLIILVVFSPGFIIPFKDPSSVKVSMPVLWAIMGAIAMVAFWCLGRYYKASFQKTLGLFRYESGFFLPWKVIEGSLRDIERVELDEMRAGEGHGVHYRLSFRYKGKGYLLALGGPEAQPEVAQKLASLIGCPFETSKGLAKHTLKRLPDRTGDFEGIKYTVAHYYEEPIVTVEILLETKLSRPLEINARERAPVLPNDERRAILQALLDLGADYIDVGFNADRVAAEFQETQVTVDEGLAQKIAALLIPLREKSI